MRLAFEMPATIDAVDPTVVFPKAVAAGYLSEAGLTGFEVALSEALADIVAHGVEAAGGAPDAVPVSLGVPAAPDTAAVVTSDRGRPAPPGLYDGIADLGSIDVLAEDGRGLPLVAHFADDVRYRFENGTDRLTPVFARGRR